MTGRDAQVTDRRARAMEPTIAQLERRLMDPPDPGAFDPSELDGLPKPVRDHLTAAIVPGAPLARTAQLRMNGTIALRRWIPFRAHQTLTPHRGFLWHGRAAALITGSDRYVDGEGVADWRVFGRSVMHAEGVDASRASAGRCGAEAIWVPTVLLPRFGVAWTAEDERHITARYEVDDVPIVLELELDERAHLRACVFQRWGDPERTGTAGWHPFGGRVTAYAHFGPVVIPQSGRFGWFYGTERWETGEFFRYHISHHRLVTDPSRVQADGRRPHSR
jgi:hypothetical protein